MKITGTYINLLEGRGLYSLLTTGTTNKDGDGFSDVGVQVKAVKILMAST